MPSKTMPPAVNRLYDIDAAAPVIVDNSALLPLIYEDGI